jgi:DNA polymerase-3 subunit epsilon
MTRSVLFDTETTGLDPAQGHRVIEVAALELENDLPTGKHFHALIQPDRDVPEESVRIHGITAQKLKGQPRFADIADKLLEFFGDGMLVAHNAPFDFAFISAELKLLGRPGLHPARMVDTLALAKVRYPGLPNSLDALCRRFGIDLSERTSHNALLDCKLLGAVYVELTGGRQRGLSLQADDRNTLPAAAYAANTGRTPRLIVPTPEELAAHAAFIARMKDPVWAFN